MESHHDDPPTEDSTVAGLSETTATMVSFQKLKFFIKLDGWPASETEELLSSLKSIPENQEDGLTDHLLTSFTEYIDESFPDSVKSKVEVMQCLKKDWFSKDALELVKTYVADRAAMLDFKPLVEIKELDEESQNEARNLLLQLKPGHLPQLEHAAKTAWSMELQSYGKASAWLVADPKRCASLEKAYFQKHYYALMKGILSSGEFNFEPLVHPSELMQPEEQERACALLPQVKEEHILQIQSQRDEAWASQLPMIQCLSPEEQVDAEKAFNYHVYWDIVASVLKSENATEPANGICQGAPCTHDANELKVNSWNGDEDVALRSTGVKRTLNEVEGPTLPQRRKRMAMETATTKCTVMDVVTVHTKATINQLCTLEAGVMFVDDEIRSVHRKNIKTNITEQTTVGLVQLADSRGVIACSFWGSLADTHWADLEKKLDESLEQRKAAFYRITHLSVTEHKSPAVTQLRRLNTTEQTTLQFLGMQSNTVRPHESILLKDFTLLTKPTPHVCCLQGTVAEPCSCRQSAHGVQMCAFQLVSREGLAVSCVAFGSNAMLPFLEPNVQVVIFGAQALDDRQNPNSGKGTLWVYDDAFVLMTGEVEKPPRIVRNVPLQ